MTAPSASDRLVCVATSAAMALFSWKEQSACEGCEDTAGACKLRDAHIYISSPLAHVCEEGAAAAIDRTTPEAVKRPVRHICATEYLNKRRVDELKCGLGRH